MEKGRKTEMGERKRDIEKERERMEEWEYEKEGGRERKRERETDRQREILGGCECDELDLFAFCNIVYVSYVDKTFVSGKKNEPDSIVTFSASRVFCGFPNVTSRNTTTWPCLLSPVRCHISTFVHEAIRDRAGRCRGWYHIHVSSTVCYFRTVRRFM